MARAAAVSGRRPRIRASSGRRPGTRIQPAEPPEPLQHMIRHVEAATRRGDEDQPGAASGIAGGEGDGRGAAGRHRRHDRPIDAERIHQGGGRDRPVARDRCRPGWATCRDSRGATGRSPGSRATCRAAPRPGSGSGRSRPCRHAAPGRPAHRRRRCACTTPSRVLVKSTAGVLAGETKRGDRRASATRERVLDMTHPQGCRNRKTIVVVAALRRGTGECPSTIEMGRFSCPSTGPATPR